MVKDNSKQGFLLKWTLATFIGCIIGILMAAQASIVVGSVTSKYPTLAIGFGFGFPIGLLQWLVIRKFVAISWRWMLATAIGMGLPIAVILVIDLDPVKDLSGDMADVIMLGLVPGIIIGILQLFLLKPHSTRAGWWVMICTLGWASGWASALAGISVLGAAVLGVITGRGLIWIFENPDSVNPLRPDSERLGFFFWLKDDQE